jgi:hypothetical protein
MSALPGPAGDVELVRQFSAVLTRACGPAESRFPSATEFREALLSIGTNA